jgi:hypothetical protein
MTHHKIIAADWQLKAAEQSRLGAVIVPLVPQIKNHVDGIHFVWNNKPATSWLSKEASDIAKCSEFPYQPGDRLYLAEQWCEYDDEYILRIEPDCEVSDHEDSWLSWQPAETMPPEAAQYWVEVVGVRVAKMRDLTFAELRRTGLHYRLMTFSRDIAQSWNDTYPGFQWDGSRWVVVMEVKPCQI